VSGGERLSPKTRAEAERLAAIGAPSDWRLACQTYARKDAVVEIPEAGERGVAP
jgi:ferredoxin